jgi:3-methyladenine DNA glycosylase AlkD
MARRVDAQWQAQRNETQHGQRARGARRWNRMGWCRPLVTAKSLTATLRKRLESEGDADRAAAQRAYMKSTMPYAGVTAPAIKRVTAALVTQYPCVDAQDWQRTVESIWDHARYREERYVAVGFARARQYRQFRTPAVLPLYEKLIVAGAWWDFVDEIAINLVGELVLGHPKATKPVMRRWAHDDDIWKRRTAILCQLKAKVATDTRLLTAVIAPSMTETEFFLRKAIGWALREYSKTDPNWVIGYVTDNRQRLSSLSKREGLKVLLKDGRVAAVP